MGVQKGRRSGSSKLKATRLFLRRTNRTAAAAHAVGGAFKKMKLDKNKRTLLPTGQNVNPRKSAPRVARCVLLEQ